MDLGLFDPKLCALAAGTTVSHSQSSMSPLLIELPIYGWAFNCLEERLIFLSSLQLRWL